MTASSVCPATFVESGPGEGWCTLGESCLAIDSFHDYGLYQGSHGRVVSEWLAEEDTE